MNIYLLLKSLHIIAIIAWMAGLLYLPRIFVYHCQTSYGSEAHEKFVQMEYRLLKYIMNPAMIISWILGIALLLQLGHQASMQFWVQAKLVLVLAMSGFHGFLGSCRKKFEANNNQRTEKFYRLINEIPTVLMIIIVFLVIFKPI
ncbi:MAG: protoporphyrinogen oxidase HemJ [Methylophilaceae bacterium]|jgi:putative membrane protein